MEEILMPDAVVSAQDLDQEIVRLADLGLRANGPALRFLNRIGAQADQLLDRLPNSVRDNLEYASEQALMSALRHSTKTRVPRFAPEVSQRGERLMGAALGAVGGAGGLAGTLVELPITTAFLLRVIQKEGQRQGFDPRRENVQFDIVRVFSAPGPFGDDQSETGFLATRLGLNSTGINKLVSQIAPKLGVALGQKLAVQAAPIVGGVAGASCNYIYADYYQKIANLHFSVRKLAVDCDIPEVDIIERMQRVHPASRR